MEVFDQLLTIEFALVVAGIFAVIFTLRTVLPETFSKGTWGYRLLPVAPLVVGALAMAFIPGLSSFEGVGAKVFHGLFAGFFAGQFHKIGKQTFLAPILEKVNGKADTSEDSTD